MARRFFTPIRLVGAAFILVALAVAALGMMKSGFGWWEDYRTPPSVSKAEQWVADRFDAGDKHCGQFSVLAGVHLRDGIISQSTYDEIHDIAVYDGGCASKIFSTVSWR